MDLTGIVIDLTGRVSSLETANTYINQQLLQRPGLSEFSQFQNVWNRQLEQTSDAIAQAAANIRVLQQLFVNLNMTVSSLTSQFTGHTGAPNHYYTPTP